MTARAPRRIKRLGHIALRTPDVPRAEDFYTRVVGLVRTDVDDGVVYLRSRFEHHCLALHRAHAAGADHFGWETDGDLETEALRAALAARGVTVAEAPAEPGRRGLAFRFQDSLGMWNEVYGTSQRLAALVPEAGAGLRLAHVTRMTPDPDRDQAFFRAAGFRMSDWVPGVQAFLRCAPEHHSVGFLKFERPMLHHHAFDVGSWDAIKTVLDRATQQRWKVDAGPVRHAAGNNIAVYIRDPDGVRVEFFCEMEAIDDDDDHDDRRQPVIFDLWHQSAPPPGFRD
jgi:catechol 2,3-dioxygenase-like lactoylglutathione lyase family enzyme